MTKSLWMKFCPSDWRADPSLRMCSLAARGLWIEMIGLMHEAEPYGHLLVKGKPISAQQLAGLVSAPASDVEIMLRELESNDVFSRKTNGVIYSRRMEKDASDKPLMPEARSQKPQEELTLFPKEKPEPSKTTRGTRLPADWAPRQQDIEWCVNELFLTMSEINYEIPRFTDYWIAQSGAKGVKLNWDATFRNWMRSYASRKPNSAQSKPNRADEISRAADNVRARIGAGSQGSGR